jgi:folate-binding protein YgfZ
MPIDNSTLIPASYLTHLDNQGLIQLSGEERVKYLQGQVTADINTLSEDNALLGCHCDFKGKTWNVFYTLQYQESILMLSHQESIPASLAELKKYGVFAKVKIQEISDQWVCLAGAGENLEHLIKQTFTQIPVEHQQVVSNEMGLVMAIAAPRNRYLLLLKKPLAEEFIAKFGEPLSAKEFWEFEDIQAGIPEIRTETSTEFVPQMMNLHVLDAISFEKGCYMGQEVVARTKFLGKNKRAAFILETDQAIEIKPGDNLESQAGENWRRGGTVLRSCSVGQQTLILAVLANDTEVAATLRLKANPEVLLEVLPLPYFLE